MDKQKIIEQVLKLRKLADPNSGAFQGEMESAARKIQEFMDKYTISASDVDDAEAEAGFRETETIFNEMRSDFEIAGLAAWHWALAKQVARITHTKTWARTTGRRGRMVFFGSSENSRVALEIFDEWVTLIAEVAEKSLKDHWKLVMREYDYDGFLRRKKLGLEYGKFMDTVPKGLRTTYYKESWLNGCIDGIRSSIDSQEESRTQETSTALVPYTTALDRAYNQIPMEQAKTRERVGSLLAYASGQQFGKSVRLGSKKLS